MRMMATVALIAAAMTLPVLAAEDEAAKDAELPELEAPAAELVAPMATTLPAGPTTGATTGGTTRAIPGITVERAGPSVFFPGIVNNSATTQVFRFASGARVAGTVTAQLYDAAGASLGTWTSASIPAGAAIEVTATQIAAGSTPALTTAQQAAAISYSLSATVRGSVQQLSKTASVIVNQTGCFGGGGLSYVEGPGFTGATGAVRLTNGGSSAGTITLSLRNAATGAELGKYTSASVPAKGFVTVTASAMAAAAVPVVPASTVALSIVPTAATARISVAHLATVTASTTATNLSAACGI